LRREHDDESVNARDDGTGQRHRRRGNAGRIASIATRLLREARFPRPHAPRGPAQDAKLQGVCGTPQGKKLASKSECAMTIPGRICPGIRSVVGWHCNPFYKTQFNGAPRFSSLSLLSSSRTALAPGGGVKLAAERTAPPHLMPPNETGGAVRLL
jgi:hypothetical protein